MIDRYAPKKNPPVPQAGSQTRSPGSGNITSTIAEISARGVKYWPAPRAPSWAVFSIKPSYAAPLRSAS